MGRPPVLLLAAAAALALWQTARAAPARAPRAPATLAALTGATETEARARLGAPDLTRAEGAGALWTYRLGDCALLVFFSSEGGGLRRLSGAQASPRRRGEAPPATDACLAEAAARSGPRR